MSKAGKMRGETLLDGEASATKDKSMAEVGESLPAEQESMPVGDISPFHWEAGLNTSSCSLSATSPGACTSSSTDWPGEQRVVAGRQAALFSWLLNRKTVVFF